MAIYFCSGTDGHIILFRYSWVDDLIFLIIVQCYLINPFEQGIVCIHITCSTIFTISIQVYYCVKVSCLHVWWHQNIWLLNVKESNQIFHLWCTDSISYYFLLHRHTCATDHQLCFFRLWMRPNWYSTDQAAAAPWMTVMWFFLAISKALWSCCCCHMDVNIV